tara:strand:- start:17447 stop:17638 length:192 start_codon:yes stop_codon:yes gene_type:complete
METEKKFKELFECMKQEILKEIDEKYMRKNISSAPPTPSAPLSSVKRSLNLTKSTSELSEGSI